MAPPELPRWLVWLVIGITAIAWIALNLTSNPRTHDALFWCLIFTIIALAVLAIALHAEDDKADRVRLTRLFFVVC